MLCIGALIPAKLLLAPTWSGDASDTAVLIEGNVCDPFGFCQSWLSQTEFAAGAVVRF
jgi:hypothetical protein